MKKSNMFLALALTVVMATGISGCAKTEKPDTGYNSASIADPIEPVNRGIFAFNNVLDRFLIEPIATFYHNYTPDAVQDSIQNFMRNLRSPLIIANNLLQGNLEGAGNATARFLVNSTAGVGGLFDAAAAQGYTYAPEDFGQTLAVWGFGDGFYLVLPVFGPSSLRDTAGLAGDILADPVRIYAQNTDNDWIYYTRGAVEGIDNRARMLKAIKDLRKNSLDYYAAVRSAYAQKRKSLIKNKSSDDAGSSAYSIPDYEDNR